MTSAVGKLTLLLADIGRHTLWSNFEVGSQGGRMPGGQVVRRLAAIMATDVVGYSKLMGVDEVGTHCPSPTTRSFRKPTSAISQMSNRSFTPKGPQLARSALISPREGRYVIAC
jgi:hypothetical protein